MKESKTLIEWEVLNGDGPDEAIWYEDESAAPDVLTKSGFERLLHKAAQPTPPTPKPEKKSDSPKK